MGAAISQTLETQIHIRWMIRRDMQEVLQTEQESYHVPWTEDDFLHCLRQRNCIGMGAELGDKVVGHVIYELHRNRLHILNLAIHPKFRRHHVGAQLISKLIGKLSSHRRAKITLELRESNLVAQLFLKSLGFVAIKVVKNYYDDTHEDAYFMEYRLPGQIEEGEEFKPRNRISKFDK
ncbi:MAG TPA: ribosomal protein S18-alanine N-acetyltransferase [Gemmatales bacterium]|nr:ribosomal protein S18-alanine N-acetyltransferase [Gemmatales bacterium]